MASVEASAEYFQYFFPIDKIPTIDAKDPKLDEYIQNSRPVVIKNSYLVESACKKWSLDYLSENLTQAKYNVFRAASNRFLYWDEKKLNDVKNFKKPTESINMTFKEFMQVLENSDDDDDDGYRYYLQQALNNSVDKKIVEDFVQFNWSWITEKANAAKWGELTTNLLLIGQPGNVTPCHYDEQENFFAQVGGHKRCILFSPSMFKCLYPFPVFHPCDRQAMADLKNPNFNQFPKLKELKACEALVGPGDVLYIPTYWFHQIESLNQVTISVNFWYKARSGEEIIYPLRADQKVAMMRNIEKMISTALQNNDEVPEFFETLTLGRYSSHNS